VLESWRVRNGERHHSEYPIPIACFASEIFEQPANRFLSVISEIR